MQKNRAQDIIKTEKQAENRSAGKDERMVYMSPASIDMTMVWLIAMIALLVVEGLVPGLVSIWFALGALAAMLSSLLHATLWLQVVWFFAVSIISLWLTRPFARKYVNARTTPTNADMVIGRECIVIEDIDNNLGTGAVSVGGKIWTARMDSDDKKAEKGTKLTVLRIEGVKLIVKEDN